LSARETSRRYDCAGGGPDGTKVSGQWNAAPKAKLRRTGYLMMSQQLHETQCGGC